MSLCTFAVASTAVALQFRAHPDLGPPVVFGAGLGLMGLAAGALLAAVVVAWRTWRGRRPA